MASRAAKPNARADSWDYCHCAHCACSQFEDYHIVHTRNPITIITTQPRCNHISLLHHNWWMDTLVAESLIQCWFTILCCSRTPNPMLMTSQYNNADSQSNVGDSKYNFADSLIQCCWLAIQCWWLQIQFCWLPYPILMIPNPMLLTPLSNVAESKSSVDDFPNQCWWLPNPMLLTRNVDDSKYNLLTPISKDYHQVKIAGWQLLSSQIIGNDWKSLAINGNMLGCLLQIGHIHLNLILKMRILAPQKICKFVKIC